jgi:hypothetical protein
MKLELKHLAAYLPYGLKVKHEGNITMLMTCERKKGDFLAIESVIDGYGKPILRPLSDLTKEITHNGQTFVPKSVIDMAFPAERMGLNPATWSHRVITKLIEWHFDVFGLIEKGLAIDINSL